MNTNREPTQKTDNLPHGGVDVQRTYHYGLLIGDKIELRNAFSTNRTIKDDDGRTIAKIESESGLTTEVVEGRWKRVNRTYSLRDGTVTRDSKTDYSGIAKCLTPKILRERLATLAKSASGNNNMTPTVINDPPADEKTGTNKPVADSANNETTSDREARSNAVSLDPKNAKVYCERGKVYGSKGDYDKAIADFTEAIRLDPKNAEAYSCRGWTYTLQALGRRGDFPDHKTGYDKAIADFTEAVRFDPNNAEAYSGRGTAYLYKTNYSEAITDCSEAIRLNPKDAKAHRARGAAYLLKTDYDKAIADSTEAISLDPTDAGAYNCRSTAYDKSGDKSKAKADLDKVKQLSGPTKTEDADASKAGPLTGTWKNAGGVQVEIADDGKSITLQVGETPNLISLDGTLTRTAKAGFFEGSVQIVCKADRKQSPIKVSVRASLVNEDELKMTYTTWPTFSRAGVRQSEDTRSVDNIKRVPRK